MMSNENTKNKNLHKRMTKMEFVKTDKAPAAIGPYSQAVKINGMVYTSGQIALRSDGTMVEDDVV